MAVSIVAIPSPHLFIASSAVDGGPVVHVAARLASDVIMLLSPIRNICHGI